MITMESSKEEIIAETKRLIEEIAKMKEGLEKAEALKTYKSVAKDHAAVKASFEASLKELESM